MKRTASIFIVALADLLPLSSLILAQDMDVQQDIIEVCNEVFLSSSLRDDCDLDDDPDDLDEDDLLSWLRQCTCETTGYGELYACCVVDEYIKRQHEDVLRQPVFPCPFSTSTSHAICPTFSNAIRNFETSATSSVESSASATPTHSITKEPTASSTESPPAGTYSSGVGNGDSSDGAEDSENDRSGENNSHARTIGLGVGLGLGIPLVLGIAGYLGFRHLRSRQVAKQDWPETSEQQGPLPHPSSGMSSVTDRWHSPGAFSVTTEHGDKRLSELMGSSPSERESAQGRYELASDMVPISELPASSEWTNEGKGS